MTTDEWKPLCFVRANDGSCNALRHNEASKLEICAECCWCSRAKRNIIKDALAYQERYIKQLNNITIGGFKK